MTAIQQEFSTSTLRDRIRCPKCRSGNLVTSGSQVRCENCGSKFAVRSSILDLVGADSLTQLERGDYDAKHKISAAADSPDFQRLVQAVGDVWKPNSRAVEIGCGTGAWTLGLAKHPNVKALLAVDISRSFLATLSKRLDDDGLAASLAAVDLNTFDLEPGSVDMVAGRSILHHILTYPELIRRTYQWLAPGGFTVFFEPVLEGKALMAFFIDAIKRMDRRLSLSIFSEEELRKMEAHVQHIKKELHYRNKPHELAKLEDKYIFRIEEMRRLALSIGFSQFKFKNYNAGDIDLSGLRYFFATLGLQVNLTPERMEKFKPLFEAYAHTVGALFPHRFITPMGYFIFVK